MKNYFLLLVSFLLINSCSSTPTLSTSTSGNRPLAYQVSLSGKPSKLTILGSLHLGTPEMYPLPAPLLAAFEHSTTLILEADLGVSPDPSLLMSKIQMPPGITLSSCLDGSTVDHLKLFLPTIGLRLQDLEPFQPWYVDMLIALKVIQESGLKSEMGIDRWFYDRKDQDGKSLRALETMEFQLGILAPHDLNEQTVSLKDTLKQSEDFPSYMEALVNSWKQGDERVLADSYLKPLEEQKSLYTKFIVARNIAWVNLLTQWMIEDQSYFMVVGVAHLLGNDGVPVLLKKMGFTVERL